MQSHMICEAFKIKADSDVAHNKKRPESPLDMCACLLLYFVTVSSYTLHYTWLPGPWAAASLAINMNIWEHVIKLKEMRFKTLLNRMKSHCFVLTFHHLTEFITITWLELCLLRSEDRGSKAVTKGLVSDTTPAHTEHLPPTLTFTRNVTLMTAGHKNIINNTHCWLGNGKNQK